MSDLGHPGGSDSGSSTSSSRSKTAAFKWIIGSAFALAIAIFCWIVFIQPIGTMDWALVRVNSHQSLLDDVLRIVKKNPDICYVGSGQAIAENLCPIREDCYLWTKRGFNTKCARPVTANDRRDYLLIDSLMKRVPIYGLQIHRDDTGKIGSIEFGIYEGSLIPWRHPFSGIWSPDNQIYATGCKHATARGWFVCEDKMIWWL